MGVLLIDVSDLPFNVVCCSILLYYSLNCTIIHCVVVCAAVLICIWRCVGAVMGTFAGH
jgi:hypothetical protein